jgi:hypothetical protein
MAQVADPQDTSASNPESLGSADEVLSQLAGSEIDRLLAEADVEAPQPSAESEPSGPTRPNSASSVPDLREAAAVENELGLDEASLTSQLDELFNQLQDETAAKAAQMTESPSASPPPVAPPEAKAAKPPPAAPAAEAAPTEGAERAALLEAAGFESPEKPAESETTAAAATPASGATTEHEAATSAPAAQPAATTPTAPSAAAEASAAAPPATQEAGEASERSAVLSAAGFETTDAGSTPLPMWIKPLVWINAPIRRCSPAVRHAMGRAAIVTLINSVLVLTYIAFTHRHH